VRIKGLFRFDYNWMNTRLTKTIGILIDSPWIKSSKGIQLNFHGIAIGLSSGPNLGLIQSGLFFSVLWECTKLYIAKQESMQALARHSKIPNLRKLFSNNIMQNSKQQVALTVFIGRSTYHSPHSN
jgi:hypothetical protein